MATYSSLSAYLCLQSLPAYLIVCKYLNELLLKNGNSSSNKWCRTLPVLFNFPIRLGQFEFLSFLIWCLLCTWSQPDSTEAFICQMRFRQKYDLVSDHTLTSYGLVQSATSYFVTIFNASKIWEMVMTTLLMRYRRPTLCVAECAWTFFVRYYWFL